MTCHITRADKGGFLVYCTPPLVGFSKYTKEELEAIERYKKDKKKPTPRKTRGERKS